jgi:hypothetical protein
MRSTGSQGFADAAREELEEVFAGRLTIPLETAAKYFRMSPKTLRAHCRAGHIGYVQIGFGEERMRREFTRENIESFFRERARRGEGREPPRKGAPKPGNWPKPPPAAPKGAGFLARRKAEREAKRSKAKDHGEE